MYTTLNSQLEKLQIYHPKVEKVAGVAVERPVTPVYDEVVEPAATLDELHNLLKRRLLVTRTWALSFLAADEQEELASILFSETTRIWPDLASCGHMALLTKEQNEVMLRRMTIYVVTTCEIIFDRHIELFRRMLKVDIFEKSANFVRVKRMLSDEANKLLDVLTVRRYIGDDIRAIDDRNFAQHPETNVKDKEISFTRLVSLSRPPAETNKKFSLEADIRALKAQFPQFDLATLRTVLSTLPALPPIRMSSKQEGLIESSTALLEESANDLLINPPRRIDRIVNEKTIAKRAGSAKDTVKFYEPEFSSEQNEKTFITQAPELTAEVKKVVEKSTKMAKFITDAESIIQPLLKTSLYLDGISRRTAEKQEKIDALKDVIAKLEQQRQVAVKRSPYIQPDYFEVPISKDVMMRASGIRVTERQLEAAICLKPFLPLYDELTLEITEQDIATMDDRLFVTKELSDVYKEIVAVIPKDYVEVSSDKAVQPAASGNLELSRCISSTRIHGATGGGSAQITKLLPNDDLVLTSTLPPWHKEGHKSWVKSGPSKALCTTNRVKISEHTRTDGAAIARSLCEHLPDYMDPKLFLSWHSWWRQIFTTSDYYKYLNRQHSDFVSFIYHLWGDEGGRDDSAMGLSSGSGTPISSASSRTRVKRQSSVMSSGHPSNYPTPQPVGTWASGPGLWTVDSAVREKLETEADIKDKREKAQELAKEAKAHLFGHTYSISIADLASQRIEKRIKDEKARRKLTPDEVLEKELAAMTIHDRFMRVWDLLRMDESFRTRLIFKYSSSDTARLLHVVKLWEAATHAILKREYVLGQFEQFERIASDPNRFYDKGYLGSSQARFDEEVVRSSLVKQLDELEITVKAEITKLANGTAGDVAMFRNRPYVDKMLVDRVQVLFWLSEERKANAIRQHLTDKKLNEALSSSRIFTTRTPRETTLATEMTKTTENYEDKPLVTVKDILTL